MTVRELIEYLSKQNPEMEVVVNGYEDGFDPIGPIYKKYVTENPHPKDYYGKYMECKLSHGKIVLVLPR